MIDDPKTCHIRICWEPIESAPKDEHELLLYCEPVGAYVGKWFVNSDSDSFFQKVVNHGGDRKIFYAQPCINPTHWLPLPDNPVKDKE